MLDAHPHLRHHHRPGENPQLHPPDHHLALLHRPGLHQQVGAVHTHTHTPSFAPCSSLNPVLYGYLDENFKRCFREFCTPSPSVLEMQNSSRTGATTRKLQQRETNSANTAERSNQQVRRRCCKPLLSQIICDPPGLSQPTLPVRRYD